MSTPSMALIKLLKVIFLFFALIWVFMIVVSGIYNFHLAYSSHTAKKNDDKWLLTKCSEPDFFIRLKQHTDLCDSITKNAQSNAILFALNQVVSTTHVCGSRSCFEIASDIVNKLGWQAVLLLGIVAVVVAHTTITLLRTYMYSRINRHEGFFSSSKYHNRRYPMLDLDDDYNDDNYEQWGRALRRRVQPSHKLTITENA